MTICFFKDEDSDENSDNLKSTTYAYVTQQTTRSSTVKLFVSKLIISTSIFLVRKNTTVSRSFNFIEL